MSGDRSSRRASAPKPANAGKKARSKPAGKRSVAKRASRKDAPRAQPEEVSAGGVVVRGEEVVVIVPRRRSPDGTRVLGLPKGHLDPGETELQAARREVLEETGVDAEPVRKLGETRYTYKRGRRNVPKVVSFYLFTYVGGDTADHDDEVEEARWIALAEAKSTLTHLAEREMVVLALASLEENARKDR